MRVWSPKRLILFCTKFVPRSDLVVGDEGVVVQDSGCPEEGYAVYILKTEDTCISYFFFFRRVKRFLSNNDARFVVIISFVVPCSI